MTATRYTLNAPAVVYERMDGEVIVIHLTSGCYYNLQGSAAFLWECLVAGWSAAEIGDRIALATGQSVATAIADFLAAMLAEDLIVLRADAPREDPPALADLTTFTAPEIQKFTDMQELLLVDPIHEVTEAGWPQVAPPAA